MFRTLHLICAAMLLAGTSLPPGRAQTPYPGLASLDILRYRIRIEISDTTSSVVAQTEITAAVLSDTLRAVTLDFLDLTIDSVSVNGKPCGYRQDSSRIVVDRPPPTHGRDTMRIAVAYHGRPRSGLIIGVTKFGDPSVFADNWPDRARGWFPCIDHPYDKAAAEVIVIAPRKFDVVGNGVLQQVLAVPGERRLWHWSESKALPTYCIVFGAAEFSTTYHGSVAGVPIFHCVYGREPDQTGKSLGRTERILRAFSDLIGPYPYGKLALVESPTHFGGMENASAIFLGEHLVGNRADLESLSAHEIAHQWFGDCVTPADWNHLWLSEGFAVYCEKLFTELFTGKEQFRRQMLGVRQAYLRYDTAGTASLVPPAPEHPSRLLTPVSYDKGACVLHMLRREIGDSAFFRGARTYFSEFSNSTAVTADLQRSMERESGMPLGWFFRQWVTSPGYPALDIRWTWDQAEERMRIRVFQRQPGGPFRFPLDLELVGASSRARETILVRNREESFSFPLKFKPVRLVVDPEAWILQTSDVR